MKRVLFAHQSSIPHYRIPFYNALERMRPEAWCFKVVFDPSELNSVPSTGVHNDRNAFEFPTLNVNTFSWALGNRTLRYQTFFWRAGNYDLVIVEDAINNLTYPLSQLHQIRGTRFGHWGLGRDRKIKRHSPITFLVQQLKLLLDRSADGYFAYTESVKTYMLENGLRPDKVIAVNNTIDINLHRSGFEKLWKERDKIRFDYGIKDKNVLLFVSTFKKSKKADYLLEAFSILRERDPSFFLMLIGSGAEVYLDGHDRKNVSYFGTVEDPEKLAPFYLASDVFSYPGQVGLAPLQALCYSLPIVAVESPYLHGPEIEYLTPENSWILDASTTPEGYALAIEELFRHPDELASKKSNSWPSIQHLTVEQMAQRFIAGINRILEVE